MKGFNSSQLKADLFFHLLSALCSADGLMNNSVFWDLAWQPVAELLKGNISEVCPHFQMEQS